MAIDPNSGRIPGGYRNNRDDDTSSTSSSGSLGDHTIRQGQSSGIRGFFSRISGFFSNLFNRQQSPSRSSSSDSLVGRVSVANTDSDSLVSSSSYSSDGSNSKWYDDTEDVTSSMMPFERKVYWNDHEKVKEYSPHDRVEDTTDGKPPLGAEAQPIRGILKQTTGSSSVGKTTTLVSLLSKSSSFSEVVGALKQQAAAAYGGKAELGWSMLTLITDRSIAVETKKVSDLAGHRGVTNVNEELSPNTQDALKLLKRELEEGSISSDELKSIQDFILSATRKAYDWSPDYVQNDFQDFLPEDDGGELPPNIQEALVAISAELDNAGIKGDDLKMHVVLLELMKISMPALKQMMLNHTPGVDASGRKQVSQESRTVAKLLLKVEEGNGWKTLIDPELDPVIHSFLG